MDKVALTAVAISSTAPKRAELLFCDLYGRRRIARHKPQVRNQLATAPRRELAGGWTH